MKEFSTQNTRVYAHEQFKTEIILEQLLIKKVTDQQLFVCMYVCMWQYPCWKNISIEQ